MGKEFTRLKCVQNQVTTFILSYDVDNCNTVSITRERALMVIEDCQVVLGSGGDDDGDLLLGLDLVHHTVV